MQTLVFDVEGNDLLPGLTKIWCIGIADPSVSPTQVDLYTCRDDEYPSLQEGLDRLSACDRAVAHNGIHYDYWALNKIYPGTFRDPSVIWDSVAMSQLLYPERQSHALSSWGKQFGLPKGEYSDFSQFSEEMLPYLIRDVELNVMVYHHLQDEFNKWFAKGVDYRQAIDLEHKVHYCLALQSQHGFRMNLDLAQQLDAELSQEMQDILTELQSVFPPQYKPVRTSWCYKHRRWTHKDSSKHVPEFFTPKGNNAKMGYTAGVPLTKVELTEFNPGSTDQIAQRLSSAFGWQPSSWTKAGSAEVKDETLQGLPYPEAVAIRRYLRLKKMIGMLSGGKNAWLRLEENGYVHGYVKSCGARTHRMSHNSPNMAQVDKKDKRMRQVWIPDPGHVLVGCDASGLEMRIMAHYLSIWDGGAYTSQVLEGDPHMANVKIIGMCEQSRDDLVKTWFYALIYGAGDLVLGLTVMQDLARQGITPTKTARGLGRDSRLKLEEGLAGYKALVEECKARDKNAGWMKLPDGRAVKTAGAHSATNTLFQGAGSIVMKQALAMFHFEHGPKVGLVDDNLMPVGWNYCANVHDEVQFTCDPSVAELVGETFRQSIVDAGVALGITCPMDGSVQIGSSWAETH